MKISTSFSTSPSISPRKKRLLLSFAILAAFALGIIGAFLSTRFCSEDALFEKLTTKIFKEEVTANTLTLHYTLADPNASGIDIPDITLGSLDTDFSSACARYHTYESDLLSFDPEKISREHQIVRDTLLVYFHTQQQLLSYPLLYEPLSPSLGIQAQLPILLSEYTFYQERDILDYLKLLSSVRPYFESILAYEQKKADAGLFMSKETRSRIQKQCLSFLSDTKNNYMQQLFEEHLQDMDTLSQEEKFKLLALHQKLLQTEVFPAYQMLLDGLSKLNCTDSISHGLADFPNGAAYYRTLFQSETGIYEPITEVEQRLSRQLLADTKQIQLMLKEQPALISKMNNSSLFASMTPEQILDFLKDTISKDFPPLSNTSFELRNVHPSMQEYLSPAFYLTPPIDTGTPNVIYINPKNHASGLELFTTLAHEGFPGHLYQTISFEQEHCSPIRYLITTPGYTEGWATYVESWASKTAAPLIQDPVASDITQLYILNRNVNLCLYSLLDIGIHNHGWSLANVSRFLAAFGIKNPDTVHEIYQYIAENPANYPKYYASSLEFQRLKEEQIQKKGKDFSLKEFHQKLLSIGPVPFPVLKKYFDY